MLQRWHTSWRLRRQDQASDHHAARASAGFTLVELLIATSVFATILIIFTTTTIQMSHKYYQGLTATTTQDATRSVLDTVSQAIQFSGGQVKQFDGTANAIDRVDSGIVCVGDQYFVYQKYNYEDSQVKFRSYTGTCPDSVTQAVTHPAAGGKELIGAHMRLYNFDFKALPGGKLYQLTVSVAYGDSDLLCDRDNTGATNHEAQCSSPDAAIGSELHSTNLACKGMAGEQFCATSSLSTIVERRLQ